MKSRRGVGVATFADPEARRPSSLPSKRWSYFRPDDRSRHLAEED